MAEAALAIAPGPDKPVQPDELPLLEAAGITKLYGDFVANDNINLEIWPAEVHALLGENGAGKSTLVKMIYGLLQPSAGEFHWQGQPIVLSGPAAARARGIGMVFQHFSLFEQLTVAENVALGLDKAELAGLDQRVREVSRSYGLPLEPKREVWRLLVGRGAADRDRALSAAGPEAVDPRRADLGADPAGGRAAIPHAACAA